MRQTRLTQFGHMVVLLAGPISDTGIQYIDFVDIFNVSLDLGGFPVMAETTRKLAASTR